MKSKIGYIIICISMAFLAGCKEPESVEPEYTPSVFEVVTSTSGESFITDEILKNNPDAKNVIAFNCYYHYDDGTEGGFSSTNYYVVIKDSIICIYGVNRNTTADNGYTVKYEQTIDTETIDEIKRCVEDESWKDLYDRIQIYANTIEGVVVSEGMNDTKSRKEDGSYLWEDEFYSMFQ